MNILNNLDILDITNDHEELVDQLIDLASSKRVRSFNSSLKRLYRYVLCGIFTDIINGRDFTNTHPNYFRIAKSMIMLGNNFKNSESTIQGIKEYMLNSHFKVGIKSNEDQEIIEVLKKFNLFLDKRACKGQTLFLASELNEIIFIEEFCEKKGFKIKMHHWIDFNFTYGLTHTIPEFFNYIDIINTWNYYIEVYDEFKEATESLNALEYNQFVKVNPRARELIAIFSTQMRLTIVSSVTYVESYLYYYYYNIKNSKNYIEEESLRAVFDSKKNIQDTQIIKDVLCKIHPHIKDDEQFKELYKKYIETNKLRNRYMHTSAFVDKSNQTSELQPLISVKEESWMDLLQASIDFVVKIESMLPQSEKILFWWDRYEYPIFKKCEKISVINLKKQF
ncbi:hypothetical protein Q0N30_12440 [Priestia megaterium]|uniref:hypothetical protein n=1 Tax=Priestia megaterium TaxID=1404 RepID=UPI003459EACE